MESLAALGVLGATLAVALPPLSAALEARARREGMLEAALLAQSLLDAHAPPGAARAGEWRGRAPGGPAWRVEVGAGEAGAGGVALRPVRVTVGALAVETLRPGPVEPGR